ncbi:MAG: flagellar motor switch phosphatase FliY [Defluviitaleaceae bacterium]|nr:flagellar motor switch phosphatase FliY [Defluviitaleaceae bacterium]
MADKPLSQDEQYKNDLLTSIQTDTLGEIGNISMGTAATSLSTLLNQKVSIDTPHVKVMSWQEISDSYDRPCIGAKIDYTVGLEGSNLLILKSSDAKIIVDLMMGGNGDISGKENEKLNEIDISAVGEAMNQMIGSSSTALSTLINRKIDIATPQIEELDLKDGDFYDTIGFGGDPIVVVVFKLVIGDLINSSIMQVIPLSFAGELSDFMLPSDDNSENNKNIINNSTENTAQANNGQAAGIQNQQNQMEGNTNMGSGGYSSPVQKNANASLAQFQSFEGNPALVGKENINILMDVPLEVTVELGKTSKRIKDILEFSPGTIIELNKLAGEPIDVLVNGKYVAKGEVVVIDENFGIRVTSIISPELRI